LVAPRDTRISSTPQGAGTELPARFQPTLTALARTIVPQAFGSSPAAADVMRLLELRFATAPEPIRRELVLGFRIFESALARLLISGTTKAWAAMGDEERQAAFSRWGSSRFGFARTIYELVRRLVLAVYFTTPGAHHDIGILPPLHRRQPIVPWEGPVQAELADDSAVVARGPRIMPVARTQPLPAPVAENVTPGRLLGGQFRISTDAVVIGSGAAGAVVAARLAESGREVVILEEGSYLTAHDFVEDEATLFPRLFADAGLRATDDLSITLLQGGAAGGGTTVNWMLMLRTPEFVLEEWAQRFGLRDLSPARMAAAFDSIERELHADPVPHDAHSPANRLLLDGARALGWKARAASINAQGCLRTGRCTLGCRYQAKQSGLITFLPRAFAHGARLFSEVRVERIELLERQTSGNARPLKRVHARATDPATGAARGELHIDAPLVVLAAGAVGTPVILQQSGMGGGAVGRYLRLHPTTAVMGEFEHDIYPLAGIPQSALCDEFLGADENQYGFWLECPALEPALGAVATGGFGEAHRQRMMRLYRTAPIIALTRDGADLDDSNGSVTVDRRGWRRIRYRLGRSDRRTVARSVEAASRLLLAAGAKRVHTLHTEPIVVTGPKDLARLPHAEYGPNRIGLFSAHVNGTCRMGSDSRTAAVNPEGERFGVRGLYACDGSILPTSLGVNPQETIMALASIVAEQL
jgi:choline dehydrogenase-like flavoprotein